MGAFSTSSEIPIGAALADEATPPASMAAVSTLKPRLKSLDRVCMGAGTRSQLPSTSSGSLAEQMNGGSRRGEAVAARRL
eukprot:3067363-Pleurochrysis_carterae.AAC.1